MKSERPGSLEPAQGQALDRMIDMLNGMIEVTEHTERALRAARAAAVESPRAATRYGRFRFPGRA